MTDELLDKIDYCCIEAFNNEALLGNTKVLFSEDEYSEMVDALEVMCKKLIHDRKSQFDEVVYYGQVFITLVEIAKRWKNSGLINDNDADTGFWSFVSKTLSVEEEYQQKIRNAFIRVISKLANDNDREEWNRIPVVRDGQKYYATIMMHALAPINGLYSFYDLCFNVFQKDLDYSYTEEDDWIGEEMVEKLKLQLKWGYKEEKGVSIGSSIYRINIGLRSYILHPDLEDDFERFVKDTFDKINRLYGLDDIEEDSWADVNIVKWWKSVKEVTDKHVAKRGNRMPTVTSDKVVVKYVRKNDRVFLCVPPIRLTDVTDKVELIIYAENKHVYSAEIYTKRGELVVSTKQVELELNQLLVDASSIDVRVFIFKNNVEIFDSENQKATSLKREFILFSEEKELFNQVLTPSNYFVYAFDIDSLKKPNECSTYGSRFYNIYPIAGEILAGVNRKVDFVEKEKSGCLGKKACILGNVPYAEWKKEEISYQVYADSVRLTIPLDVNHKALELSVEGRRYKLSDFEMISSEDPYCGYDISSCIPKSQGVYISLYSYEKKGVLFEETMVLFDNFKMVFNSPYYYGEMDRKLDIEYGGTRKEISWKQQDDIVTYPLEDGELLVTPPNLRWRIGSGQWHSSPIIGLHWFKELVEDGAVLEIDYPITGHPFKVFGKMGKKRLDIDDISKKYKIGRFIFANEDKEEIVVCMSDRMNSEQVLFRVSTKEYFRDSPFVYRDGIVFWNVEETFIGDKNRTFVVNVGDNVMEVGFHNQDLFEGLKEDVYETIVRVKSKSIFAKENRVIYKGPLFVGKEELFRYRKKLLKINSVSSSLSYDAQKWEMLDYGYVIKDLSYFEEQEDDGVHGYYLGKLLINKGGRWQDIDDLRLPNERGEVDLINPVRIEIRSNNSLWLIAGYNVEDKDDFLGELIFDCAKGQLCNYNVKNNPFNRYKIVNLYKFKEVDYV